MALTEKQQAFVNEYLKCWNATQAAIKAGYSENSARSIGCENLTKPNIAEEIKARVNEMSMSADEALIRLGKQARGSMQDFMTIVPGANIPLIDWRKAEKNGMLDLVKKITIKDGEISFELYDSQAALKEVLKQLHLSAGESTENNQVTIKYEYPDDDDND